MHQACRGFMLKCGSLKETRRVSNASDLESAPARAALASNFAAWGCIAAWVGSYVIPNFIIVVQMSLESIETLLSR